MHSIKYFLGSFLKNKLSTVFELKIARNVVEKKPMDLFAIKATWEQQANLYSARNHQVYSRHAGSRQGVQKL